MNLRRWPRLILCVVLAAQAITNSFAATSAHVMQATQMSHCQEHAAAADNQDTAKASHSQPDCCKSQHCICDFVQLAWLTIDVPHFADVIPQSTPPTAMLEPSIAPRVFDSLRPPI